jgi:hypothetical protein
MPNVPHPCVPGPVVPLPAGMFELPPPVVTTEDVCVSINGQPSIEVAAHYHWVAGSTLPASVTYTMQGGSTPIAGTVVPTPGQCKPVDFVKLCVSRFVAGETVFQVLLFDPVTGTFFDPATAVAGTPGFTAVPAAEIVAVADIDHCPCDQEYGEPACVILDDGKPWNVYRNIAEGTFWDLDVNPPVEVTSRVVSFEHDGFCNCQPNPIIP